MCEFDYQGEGLTASNIKATCRRCKTSFTGMFYYIIEDESVGRLDFVRDVGISDTLQKHHDDFKRKQNSKPDGGYKDITATCGNFSIVAVDGCGRSGIIKYTSDNYPIGVFKKR